MAQCPYCGVALVKAPSRKTTCPKCGGLIVVRQRVPMTVLQARRHDLQSGLGVSDEEWQRVAGTLPADASPGDVAWRILNQRVLKEISHRERSIVYLHMAIFLTEEGRDASMPLREHHRARLRSWDTPCVEVLATCCETCRQYAGPRILPREDAITNGPLPLPGCTLKPYCQCTYLPVLD